MRIVPGALALFITSVLIGSFAIADEPTMEQRVNQYATVKLTSDLSHLSDNQKKMVSLLIDAAEIMDGIFWQQAWGTDDLPMGEKGPAGEATRRFVEINYGPWDRLGDNKPFIEGIGEKPEGAAFYPTDMTAEEFEKHLEENPDDAKSFKSLYTVIRRDDDKKLTAVPYSKAYEGSSLQASALLMKAAELAEDEGFKNYLIARSKALITDDYQPSDMLWMDMKENMVDIVIGPIENYEDKLFGYKAAHEGYVLIKDMEWSKKLAKYVGMLPDLQKGLPVDEKYKSEKPGSNSDLNAYDVVYYAGDCNAGSKTIAINLPNDEEVQLEKGTRRLQLKNAMRAKFDKIMDPISSALIVPEQQKHVTFDAFFGNTMFHEVAHGLGIKYTLDGETSVRDSLRNVASAVEEGKADILGLYMITQLMDKGEISEGTLEDYYVTFMAGIFRSVRFGASSSHGKANMIRFNFFKEMGAFSRNEKGLYSVDMKKMGEAMTALSAKLLTLQGNGDYDVTSKFVADNAFVGPTLQSDLDRLGAAGIPVDVVFEQGAEVLGL